MYSFSLGNKILLLLLEIRGLGVVHPFPDLFVLFEILLPPTLYRLVGDGILLLPLFLFGTSYAGSPPSETPDYLDILIESC
jgi:hypothetical protein